MTIQLAGLPFGVLLSFPNAPKGVATGGGTWRFLRGRKDDTNLVGGWTNPFEKYEKILVVKLGIISPGFGVTIKNVWVATT